MIFQHCQIAHCYVERVYPKVPCLERAHHANETDEKNRYDNKEVQKPQTEKEGSNDHINHCPSMSWLLSVHTQHLQCQPYHDRQQGATQLHAFCIDFCEGQHHEDKAERANTRVSNNEKDRPNPDIGLEEHVGRTHQEHDGGKNHHREAYLKDARGIELCIKLRFHRLVRKHEGEGMHLYFLEANPLHHALNKVESITIIVRDLPFHASE
mmetsp:Transcript_28606/g.72969  ORF Transcript_28606/g.72969 Transcript_28606/m.72969 type:complete len:210 (-) Transcript_28606:429-1058(-)